MAKRSAEQLATPPMHAAVAPTLITNVMTIMKAAYGAVPKAFWGLSHAGEAGLAGTSRLFTIDTPASFKCYCRHLTDPGPYSIVTLRTAPGFNRRITILETVRKVNFGAKFNSEIVFPSSTSTNLEEIEFDVECAFNRPIVVPNGVRIVTFGRSFNRSATLPASLQAATFGEMFNYTLDLPPALLKLYLGNRYNRHCLLPDGIQVLRFGTDFCQNISFPPSLREIEFGRNYNCYPVRLPQGLKRVTFTALRSNTGYIVFPDSLKYAYFGCGITNDPVNLTLPLGLEELVWHPDAAINVPLTVKHLTLGADFVHPLQLHQGLESIVLMGNHSAYTRNLPAGLKSITLCKRIPGSFTLPRGCKCLYAQTYFAPVEDSASEED